MHLRVLYFLALFSIFPVMALAQYTYSVGGSVYKGFIVQHTDAIGHLTQSHPVGFEVYAKKHTYGEKMWEQLHNYPDVGVALHYFDFKNPILGKTVSALSFLEFYVTRKPKSELTFRAAVGINYATNPYDAETNNKNIALGSTFAYGLQLRLGYAIQIIDRLHVNTSLTLTHFSNGAFKVPNKGINIPTLDLGLSYALSREKPAFIRNDPPPGFDRKTKCNIVFTSGFKEPHMAGTGQFPFFTLSVYLDKQVSPTNILNTGIDFFYSLAVKKEIEIDWQLPDTEHPDFKRAGLVLGHEMLIGRLSLLTQVGAYIYRPYKSDKAIYQRYALKYRLAEQFFVTAGLRSHYGSADAVEWGIGFRL